MSVKVVREELSSHKTIHVSSPELLGECAFRFRNITARYTELEEEEEEEVEEMWSEVYCLPLLTSRNCSSREKGPLCSGGVTLLTLLRHDYCHFVVFLYLTHLGIYSLKRRKRSFLNWRPYCFSRACPAT